MSAAARPPEGGASLPRGGCRASRQEGSLLHAAARPPEGGERIRKAGVVAILVVAMMGSALAVDVTDSMRKAPILDTTRPPPLQNSDNSDVRRSRNYAMQPPVVPHKIDGYQLDKNANRCMFCHSRTRTQESQAPMISVTHFIGRDGNFLAELSPRRYFCLQCHVPQVPLDPLIENRFIDVDQMLYGNPEGTPGQPQGKR